MSGPTIQQEASFILSEYRGAFVDHLRRIGSDPTGELARVESRVLDVIADGIAARRAALDGQEVGHD